MKISNISGTSFLRKNLNVNQLNNTTYSKHLTSPISDQVSFRNASNDDFYLSRSSGVVLKQDIKSGCQLFKKSNEDKTFLFLLTALTFLKKESSA